MSAKKTEQVAPFHFYVDIDDYTGTCTFVPTVCPDEYDFVCGCEGLTYSNECYADAAGVSLAHRGKCEP